MVAYVALPVLHARHSLQNLYIRGDDFYFLTRSRTTDDTLHNLLVPHNAHYSSTFRVWAWLVWQLAGSWKGFPSAAACGMAVSVMALTGAVGWLIRSETGDWLAALVAMAVMGNVSVYYTAVDHFSASQTITAATWIALTLAALSRYRARAKLGWLVVGGFFALLAAGSWTGGFLVFPAGALYLWRPKSRGSYWLAGTFVAGGVVLAAVLFLVQKSTLIQGANLGKRSLTESLGLFQGGVHSAHAVAEMFLLGNLGVSAEITPLQGTILAVAFIMFWGWQQYTRPSTPFRKLQSVGLLLLLSGLMLVLTVRSYLPFSSIRELTWYFTIPQLGFAIFLSAWFAQCRHTISATPEEHIDPSEAWSWKTLGLALVLLVALYQLHQPRVWRQMLDAIPKEVAESVNLYPEGPVRRRSLLAWYQIRSLKQEPYLQLLDRCETAGIQIQIGDNTPALLTLPVPETTGKLHLNTRDQRSTDEVIELVARLREQYLQESRSIVDHLSNSVREAESIIERARPQGP